MNFKLNLEKRTVLTLTILLLGTAIVISAVIFPTISYIKNLRDETNNLRQYLDKKYETNHSLLNSRQKIEETKISMEEYKNYLFFKGDELALITKLENLSDQNKLIQKISGTDLDKPGNTVHISLTLTGNYIDLIKYLLALEKQNYFLQIKNLHLAPGFAMPNDNPQAGVLNLDMILYAVKP